MIERKKGLTSKENKDFSSRGTGVRLKKGAKNLIQRKINQGFLRVPLLAGIIPQKMALTAKSRN